MAMVESGDRFSRADEDPGERRRRAEERCLEAEQRCFRAERRRFEAERQREQLQQLLDQARRAGLRMSQIVEELRRLVAHLHDVAEQREPPLAGAVAGAHPGALQPGGGAHLGGLQTGDGGAQLAAVPLAEGHVPGGDQMVDALTAAIARLRANVQAVGDTPPEPSAETLEPAAQEADVEALEPAAEAPEEVADAPHERAPHKHSVSWWKRWRNRRKQRKSR